MKTATDYLIRHFEKKKKNATDILNLHSNSALGSALKKSLI